MSARAPKAPGPPRDSTGNWARTPAASPTPSLVSPSAARSCHARARPGSEGRAAGGWGRDQGPGPDPGPPHGPCFLILEPPPPAGSGQPRREPGPPRAPSGPPSPERRGLSCSLVYRILDHRPGPEPGVRVGFTGPERGAISGPPPEERKSSGGKSRVGVGFTRASPAEPAEPVDPEQTVRARGGPRAGVWLWG